MCVQQILIERFQESIGVGWLDQADVDEKLEDLSILRCFFDDQPAKTVGLD